ncbi:lamin tail domain-containing protein [Pseudenhygromyxa sp. WMMC2535]|uniref:lamin tail domain-containing protein n=1 Tax=Pseudenhygromyxa sp. WMMC2535 TaxID=2712867 RepID=UPI001554E114|nr:lamin tail domain-containing protein [Pseudenhygromyxa sp. WMMC2535]NVB36201.1 lamin tail domain-containing protein [Pseudenhygromyxa sp. WMMC2535]NVB43400.1 lamin tail domain-containing protein [Pseudenhygromyxa sp. WMMC2535]
MRDLRKTPLGLRTGAAFGLFALAALGPLGCPSDDGESADEAGGDCSLLAGDLVITEVMADPEGSDDGQEWLEVYNASGAAIELEGVTLVYAKADGSGTKTHTIARSMSLGAGEYVVFGGVLDELAGGESIVDYGYADELGDFGNGGGYLAVRCEDGSTVDEIYYDEASSGASRAFDGALSPDAAANDSLGSWCDSTSEFDGPEALGTPGAANDPCGTSDTCMLDGELVAVDRPAPGELVITEVMASPSAVSDDYGEWFEFYADGDFHLNGVTMGRDVEDQEAEDIVASVDCIPISAGSYNVIAKSTQSDPTADDYNGGLPEEAIVWQTSMALTGDGALWLGAQGELLDLFDWEGAGDGESLQLDPDAIDTTANDDQANWCDAALPYSGEADDEGDLGSPGAANAQCMGVGPEGQCYDGELGEWRDIEPLAVGDLVITEHLANPAGEDATGEWFELLTSGSGDLNGLQVGKIASDTADEDVVADDFEDVIVQGDDCVHVGAGSYLLIARSADPEVNGGLPEVDYEFGVSLNNSGTDLLIGYALDGQEAAIWDRAPLSPVVEGVSGSLDPALLNTVDNDDPDNWCEGDPSTPGAANSECAGSNSGQCLDPDTQLMRMLDVPEAGEVTITEYMANPDAASDTNGEWFELHASGSFDLNGLQIGKGGVFSTTITSEDCIEIAADSYVVIAREEVLETSCLEEAPTAVANFSLSNSNSNLEIGHGDVLLDEVSWVSTATGAASSQDPDTLEWCTAVDPYGCGDLGTPGYVNPSCEGGGGMDGQCLDGDAWRDIVAPIAGDVVISEFMANPAAVGDSAGEWFELRALASFDLNGLELGRVFADGPLATVDVADCVPLAAGETALLARDDDAATNGGLPAVDATFSFGLTNSNSSLFVSSEGVLLDEIAWTSVGTGKSTSLDPSSYDPDVNDTADNADAAWCYAVAEYGDGDLGTPAADNEQCQ